MSWSSIPLHLSYWLRCIRSRPANRYFSAVCFWLFTLDIVAKSTCSLQPSSSSPFIFSLTDSATSSLLNRTKTSVVLSPPWTISSVMTSSICPCWSISARKRVVNASSLQVESLATASVGVSFFRPLFFPSFSPPAGRQFSTMGSGGFCDELVPGFTFCLGY